MKEEHYNPDKAKAGEIPLGNFTIAQFNALPHATKRRGNVAFDESKKMIPRAEKLEDTVYPVFVKKDELGKSLAPES